MTLTDERRLVTVLFADLVGFTGRAESSDPEAVRELQRAYFGAVAGEVERYGGSVEKYIGDAVMAIFGAPRAHDDDAERALRAALRIREVVATVDEQLQVRIGVNTGEVVGGMGSGPHTGEYTVSGDAVNVAARLQQAAEPNDILVGGTTRRLSAEAFAFAPQAELALKGRSESVGAWRLERELPERPRLRGGEARLIGRSREQAMLESALEEATAGRGLIVAVAGEAGIGKTRLALEMRQRAEADGFTSAWTTSRSYATAFPYHLVAQLVGQLLAHERGQSGLTGLRALGLNGDDATLERWAAVLDGVMDESEDEDPRLAGITPAGRQRLLIQAVLELVRATARRRPLLLVLDDLHWADPASLAVVEELLDVVTELPIAILAMYRSGWTHGWEGKSCYQQLNLRALQATEARQLVAELAPGGRASSALTERVVERSAGNPLFLEELLRGEDRAGNASERRLPETIHEMLLARLDALPQHARRALQLASVVGMDFSEPMVATLASDGDDLDTEDALRALQRAELIVPRAATGVDRSFAIRHPLIHEVAYRSLLVRARRTLHGRLARSLEEHGSEELVAELAHHYAASDDADKARHYLPLAGKRAERLNAGWEAKDWYLQAADAFADDPVRRAEMLEAAARQAYLVGVSDDSMRLQQDAVTLYHDAGQQVAGLNARAALGRYYWLHGDPVEAERQIALAIEGLERLAPTPELAYAYSSRSQILMLRPDFPAGVEWARKAIEVAEATEATGALAHAYNNLGWSLAGQGDESGYAYLRRSLDLSLEHNLIDDAGRAYANIAGEGSRVFPFGYEEAEAFIDEAREFAARTIPGGIFDMWIQSAHAEFLLVTGRWDEAERAIEAVDWSHGGAYNQGQASAMRSHIAAYRGRYDDAAALMSDRAEIALRIGDQQAVLSTFAARAHAQMGLGSEADAVAELRRAIEHPGSTSDGTLASWFLFEAADILTAIHARGDDVTDAEALTDGAVLLAGYAVALEAAAAIGGERAMAEVRHALFGAAVEQVSLLCAAASVDAPSISAAFPGRREATSVLDAYHRPFDAARARLWLAEERADPALAADARSVFADLGAHPYLERASALSSGSGSEPAPRSSETES